ncbi:uncharacterized protein PAC_11847 [Phialocephala subalpina]|uniref:Uncharacterized protein n=1 Tax=Phialocephala subalpina TaxID=576137 RepID=A0A1L7XA94_9HELO|nr:uncharacterized protein PAC_11847 [Phialocephala subalpina]
MERQEKYIAGVVSYHSQYVLKHWQSYNEIGSLEESAVNRGVLAITKSFVAEAGLFVNPHITKSENGAALLLSLQSLYHIRGRQRDHLYTAKRQTLRMLCLSSAFHLELAGPLHDTG